MLFRDLENLDLSANEAKVYLAALELGETSVERISKKSGVKRTTVYLAVESLGKKGLISQSKRKNKAFYYAENPQKIKHRLEEKMEAVNRMMPELLSITNLIDTKPVIRFFEGDEGIKEVFRDILDNSNEKFYAWYSEVWQNEFDNNWMNEVFTATRVKKKVWVDCIQPDNEHFRELTKTNQARLHRSKLMDPNLFKLSITLNLYGKNKIAAVSSKEKFGLIIESKEIYESLLSLHKTMWNLIPGEII
ncbi:MAG: helix-turn-helix domain-containing protein [Candidatus Moranbacteria bacterium]|nr:helix-turn-helix domain-containing protein [Candidatus Moranbacteria bacterium]